MILFHYPDNERGLNFFEFAHAQAHAALVSPRGPNLANPILDPMVRVSIGAPDLWSLDHQGAHDDAADLYNVHPSLPLPDETTGDPYWTWTNSWEHMALATAALRAG